MDPTDDAVARQKRQLVLLLVAVGVAAAVALVALFYLGMRLNSITGAAPASTTSVSTATATPTPTSTPTPVPTDEPAGPVPPGVYAWDELRGGECIDPFAGPWKEEFTVVDCATPHRAQLVARAGYPTDAREYPGADVIQAQITLLCSTPTVIDMATAGAYADFQVQGAYPLTAEQWAAGEHDYFCFVSRSSGDLLTGSIAVSQTPTGA